MTLLHAILRPVFLHALHLLRHALTLEEGDDLIEVHDGCDGDAETLLDCPNCGIRVSLLDLLLTVKCDDDSDQLTPLSLDDIHGLIDGRAGCNDIVEDDDSLAFHWCADERTSFTVVLLLLAVE